MLQSSAWPHYALLTASQTAALDRATIAQGTPGFTLMQRAGGAAAAFIAQCAALGPSLVLCGPGNNGGDGFIIAELLRRNGWPVHVAMITPPDQLSGDAAKARDLYHGEIVNFIPSILDGMTLIVDALFGVGLNRPLGRAFVTAIEAINASAIPVIAVDLPSGINADTGQPMGAAIKAQATVTFTTKKPGLLLLPGREYAGRVNVADIGMDRQALRELDSRIAENHPDLWRSLLPRFETGQHKYHHGHVLILGGAVMTGAARMAARSAQRVGTGLVTLATPPEARAIYATNMDSVLIHPLAEAEDWLQAVKDPKRSAVLLGPGAGASALLREQIETALQTQKPCLLDADALTSFAEEPQRLFAMLHKRCVLTPHTGEFARLFGAMTDDKLNATRKAAQRSGAVVLLKGADTVIAAPDGPAVINANAPSWLATGGSGDVLAGMIAGFLAQGLDTFAAACIGAWLHGSAAQSFGPGMIAEDLIEALPKALAAVRH